MAVLTQRQGRALWIDVARGGAILAMIAYHFSFHLTFFGYVDWPVAFHPAWRSFAASIASTFVFAAGVSLTYAHGERIRWRAFWRRFAIIAGCAALVTIGTVFAMPAPIYFGILHAIALFSLLALPFLAAPAWLTLAAAVAVLVLPHVYTSPMFDGPWFYPLGLASRAPFTFDYEPIFPWFGAMLLGIVAGRLVPRPAAGASGYDRANWPLRAIAAAGRNSLVIYVVHQPLLFGLLMAFNWVLYVGSGDWLPAQ